MYHCGEWPLWGWNQSKAHSGNSSHSTLSTLDMGALGHAILVLYPKVNSEAFTALALNNRIDTLSLMSDMWSEFTKCYFYPFFLLSLRQRLLWITVSSVPALVQDELDQVAFWVGICSPRHPSTSLAPVSFDLTKEQLWWLRLEDSSVSALRNNDKHSTSVRYGLGTVLSTVHVLLHVALIVLT